MDRNQQPEPPGGIGLVGLAFIFLCIVGLGSAVAAVAAVLAKQDFVGAGLCAFASALSFGMMLNALCRK